MRAERGRHFLSASVVKATILAALLRKVQAQHRGLTSREKNLAWLMITQSDNAAASDLWDDVGRYRLQRFLDLAAMTHTVLGPVATGADPAHRPRRDAPAVAAHEPEHGADQGRQAL